MPPDAVTFPFNALTASQRARLVAACAGRDVARPLAFAAGASSDFKLPEAAKAALGAAALLSLLYLILGAGFGDVESDNFLYGAPGFGLIAGALGLLACHLVRAARRWAGAVTTPVPEGAYLFPLDLVVVSGATVTVRSVASLVRCVREERVRDGRVRVAFLRLAWRTSTAAFELPHDRALATQRALADADAHFCRAVTFGDRRALAALDVLFEARAAPTWAQLPAAPAPPADGLTAPAVTARAAPAWIRSWRAFPAALLFGVVAAVPTWAARNSFSDGLGFEAGVRGRPAADCRRYLAAGGRSRCDDGRSAATDAPTPPNAAPQGTP
ncbi:MAG: hypothetical protein U0324_39260 [Polyangiales bacterium]